MRAWIETVDVYAQFCHDARRYVRLRTPTDWRLAAQKGARHLECQLTRDYHQVEKGLALGVPKRPFGAEVSERLRALVPEDGASDGAPHLGYGRDALGALQLWNSEGLRDEKIVRPAGSLDAPGPELEVLESFFRARHSIRDFDDRIPAQGDLDRAVAIGLTSPSVCNRQAWRVDFYHGSAAQEILALQNGNRGFGSVVPCVAVVSVDTRLFCGPGERNQRWIDGGIFSMTLVWGLHAVGLGTCMLNWSRTEADSARLRAVAGIEVPWDVVTLVAIGHPTAGALATRSPRRALTAVSMHHW